MGSQGANGSYPDYVCTLDAKTQEKAIKELYEDPKNRQGAIDTFRKWIQDQPHITAPLDSDYLLGFLRTAKFSQLAARTILENNMKSKTDIPEWFLDIDPLDPKIDAVLSLGYIVTLPGRTDDGHAVLFCEAGALDPSSSKYTKLDVFKACMCVCFKMMWTDDIQVHGIQEFMDVGKFTMKHQTFWGFDDIRKMTKLWQKTFPLRFKGFHYYNIGPIMEGIFAIINPLLSKKFQSRMHMHGNNMEHVYDVLPMRMLPDEYLPDDYTGPRAGTMKELVAKQKAILQSPEFVALMKERTSSKYGMDMSKAPGAVTVQESFRKLNVD